MLLGNGGGRGLMLSDEVGEMGLAMRLARTSRRHGLPFTLRAGLPIFGCSL